MGDVVEELLASLAPDIRVICRALRTVASATMPGAIELVYHSSIGYATSPSPFDRFCYVAPQPRYVNLGFFFGSALPDPQRLLEGTGVRMRHVKVWTVESAANPAIADLLVAAWNDAPERVAALHARRQRAT